MKKDKPEVSSLKKFRKEWFEPLFIALILATIFRSFIFQPFRIPSGSMEDTLLVGDQLFAAKYIYGLRLPFANDFMVRFKDPEQGDIIVFKFPEDPSKDYIKRCIATGGQTVEIKDGKVIVDGLEQKYPSGVKFSDSYHTMPFRDELGPIKVPEGHMFMMGDNRDNSYDSRFWGFVPYKNIKGKAVLIWWSWDKEAKLYDIFQKVRWERLLRPII